MDTEKEYNRINEMLFQMQEEYNILPSNFLLKKIELAKDKLKALELSISINTKGVGNYPNLFKISLN